MPTLSWIGKEAVVEHHNDVPFRPLEPVPDLSCGDVNSGNLIVQGDNLHALKALLPRYAGQVKCIYIDPPYNTGNAGWDYNDNANSQEIRDWLGDVVGDSKAMDRRDRWLCMMYPRLVMLRQFLREDGAIFVSIDDNEVATLRLLMDEIFGAKNFVATLVWHMTPNPKNCAKHFSRHHEYIILYAANKNKWRPNPIPRSEEMIAQYKNPDNDPRGPWLPVGLSARDSYTKCQYPIITPSGRMIQGPPPGRHWAVSEERFWELDRDNRIWWGKNGNNCPAIKRFLADVRNGVPPQTLWHWRDVGSTTHSKKELSRILNRGPSSDLFVTPKPTTLIQRILQIATDEDSLILDSFAGSGTTAHAVLKQNVEDGGNRRFILVEMDEGVARNVLVERVKRVVQGYTNANGRAVDGIGGGFQFYRMHAEPRPNTNDSLRAADNPAADLV